MKVTMYGILKEKKTNEFKWAIGFDTGMSPGSDFIVDFEELKSGRKLSRCFYFEENSEEKIHSFIKKLKTDSAYRESSFSNCARWCYVSQWYEKNSWALCTHRPFKRKIKNEEIFIKLFNGIKSNIETLVTLSKAVPIQNNSVVGMIDSDICDIIEILNKIKNVETQFSCRGAWYLVSSPFDNSKLMIPSEEHMPYAHVSFIKISAEVKEILLEVVPGSVFEGHFFRPKNVFHNQKFVKSLRKAILKLA